MVNHEFWKNNLGLIISLGFLVVFLPFTILTHTGYIQSYINYFIAASFVVPIAPILVSKNRKNGIIQSAIMIVLVILLTYGYWAYRNKSYLPQHFECDGPCNGWFGFENQIDNVALMVAGILGTLLGVIGKIIAAQIKRRIFF